MRSLYLLAAIGLAAALPACGTESPNFATQTLIETGRRVTGNGDLSEPRFTNGGDTNILTVTGFDESGFRTVFVLNVATLEFEVVSQADTVIDDLTGIPVVIQANDESDGGTPSRIGHTASYMSRATNLLDLRTTFFRRRHVYLRDVVDQENELISLGASTTPGQQVTRISIPEDTLGVPEANADSSSAHHSADGRFVTFASPATNIVPLAANGRSQIFVFDRVAHTMETVTWRRASNDNVFPGDGDSLAPQIATTGRFVVFQSDATNLIPNDVNNGRDIFIFDRSTRTASRLNIDPGGAATLFDPGAPTISEDGNIVVFSARPTPFGTRQIYARIVSTGTTVLVSENDDEDAGNRDSSSPSISPDGRFIAFESIATNLVPGDTNSVSDIFVYDLLSGVLARVSLNVDGEQADGDCFSPTVSPDSRFIAFVSRALNLVAPTFGAPFPPNTTLDLYIFSNPLGPQ